MPRPELFPVKKVIGFDRDMIDAINEWRATQKTLPNFSDSVRRLVEIGLRHSHKGKTHGPRPLDRDAARTMDALESNLRKAMKESD